MALGETDPASNITEYTLVYEEKAEAGPSGGPQLHRYFYFHGGI